MMKAKTILTFFLAVCMSTGASAQESKSEGPSKASISIANTKGHYVQNSKGGTVTFKLNATETQAQEIKAKLNGHEEWKLEVKKAGENTYNCKLQVQNATSSTGVARVIAYMGFDAVDFNGQQKNINELPSALNQIR